MIGLLGVTVGLARGALGVLIALVAVLLQVLFCIALARFVTTAMAGLLRSRRGKDFAAFLVIPIFALYEAFAQVVPRLAAEGKITAATFAGIDRWLRWLPPGLAAHAIQDASAGHAGAALLRLGLLAAVIVVLGGLWIRSLGRALVTVDTSTQSSAVRGAPLPFARSGIARHGGRPVPDLPAPRARARSSAGASSPSSWPPRPSAPSGPGLPRGADPQRDPRGRRARPLPRQLDRVTGPAFGLEAIGPDRPRALRAYFAGQNIALAVIAVPLLVAMSFGLAALAGHPVDGFWRWRSISPASARPWA